MIDRITIDQLNRIEAKLDFIIEAITPTETEEETQEETKPKIRKKEEEE